MRQHSPYQNYTEDRYITALDCGRSLAREAQEWLRQKAQMRFEEHKKLHRLKATVMKREAPDGL